MIFVLCILALGLILGLPVFVALAAASLAGAMQLGLAPEFLVHRMMEAVYSYPLAAVPLFLLGGELLTAGGYTRRLVDLTRNLGTRMGFGLPSVTVLVAFFLSGLTGAAVAEASALGGVLLPALRKSGIPRAKAAALVAVASGLGPIVPPSIPLILFGILAHTSIVELFWAGLIPGILITLGLLILARTMEKNHPCANLTTEHISWTGLLGRVSCLCLPPIALLASMLWGFLTITETAAGFVLLGLGFWFFFPQRPALGPILLRSATASAQVLAIIAAASGLSYVLTLSGIGRSIESLLSAWHPGPMGFLILVNCILLALGTFLETTAALYLVVPVIAPLAAAMGIDMVHLGILTVFNLVLGMVTPPFGISLFVTSAIAGTHARQVFARIWPFFLVGLAVLGLLLFFPQLSLFLPRAMSTG